MEVRPGFKQTEVGVIPADWDSATLGEVTDIHVGGDLQGDKFSTTCYSPYFFPVYSNTVADSGLYGFYSVAEYNGDSLTVVGRGVGLGTAFARTGGYGAIGRLLVLLPRRRADARFLTNYINEKLRIFVETGGIPQLTGIQFSKYKVALPSLTEQRAIAMALSDVDVLLNALDRLIAKKRDLKKGAMQQLLTGKTRLPGFSLGWEMRPLRRFVQSFIVPMRDKPKQLTGEIPWCRIEDFDGTYLAGSKSGQGVDLETVRAMNLKVYPPGTLLVSCSADLGRCAMVACPLVTNQTFIGLEMDETVSSNLFFYYYMTSKADELNNLSSGTTISYLSRQQFEEFGVYVPMEKQEQTAIASVLSDMDAEIAALEARLAKTRDIKQAMMQELLTGKTRLVLPEASHA